MSAIDRTGVRYGRLVALHVVHRPINPKGCWYWLCRCDCGTVKEIAGVSLGVLTNSCGCLSSELKRARKVNLKHGYAATPKKTSIYRIWRGMLTRCSNPNRRDYPRYGGRGITVCERWRLFENFLADMGEHPPGLSLDRINNTGNYEPGNCRWANAFEQAQNARNVKLNAQAAAEIRALHGYATSREVGRKYGVGHGTILLIWKGKAWPAPVRLAAGQLELGLAA